MVPAFNRCLRCRRAPRAFQVSMGIDVSDRRDDAFSFAETEELAPTYRQQPNWP